MADISYREYWDEIASLCSTIHEEAEEYQREPSEVLWETIDGHQWVIYTAYHFDVMKHSDNSGYSAESFGVETIMRDGDLNTAAIAFGCLYGDCLERLWEEIV